MQQRSHPLGVADHRQQVTGRQPFLAVVPNTDLLRQEEGIDNGSAKLVSVLGLLCRNFGVFDRWE